MVGHGYTPRVGFDEHFGDFDVAIACGEHEGGVVLGVAAYLAGGGVPFVAGTDEVCYDGQEAVGGGEVQRGVAFVVEVGVEEEVRVVAQDAGDEGHFGEEDGAAEARRGVDPGGRGLAERRAEVGVGVHRGSMVGAQGGS